MFYSYRGRSMWPYFQDGDILNLKKVPVSKLRTGDCIVFWYEKEHRRVVHRIISTIPLIRTKGDANAFEDLSVPLEDCFDGKVDAIFRYGCQTKIPGGIFGLVLAKWYRFAAHLDPFRNGRSGAISRMIQATLSPLAMRAFRIETKTDPLKISKNTKEKHLLLGSRPVGAFSTESDSWNILWPYSLLIDPQKL